MPFKSKEQRSKCYALERKAKKAGKKPTWNCSEWQRHTKKKLKSRYSVYSVCGSKCKDGEKCQRHTQGGGNCWQHK
jgi:hypothetical protein